MQMNFDVQHADTDYTQGKSGLCHYYTPPKSCRLVFCWYHSGI